MNTGLIIQPPPPDAPGFSGILKAGAAIPAQRFYRPGKVMDQGKTSLCVGYAACALLQAEPITQTLDPLKIYNQAKKKDGFPGIAGTTVYAGAKALEYFGVSSHAFFAYEPAKVYECIASISPVMVGLVMSERMRNPDAKGQVKAGTSNREGHCFLGYGVDYETERIYFQNSWGTKWGIFGRFWMRFAEFEKAFSREGVAVAIREIRS